MVERARQGNTGTWDPKKDCSPALPGSAKRIGLIGMGPVNREVEEEAQRCCRDVEKCERGFRGAGKEVGPAGATSEAPRRLSENSQVLEW